MTEFMEKWGIELYRVQKMQKIHRSAEGNIEVKGRWGKEKRMWISMGNIGQKLIRNVWGLLSKPESIWTSCKHT